MPVLVNWGAAIKWVNNKNASESCWKQSNNHSRLLTADLLTMVAPLFEPAASRAPSGCSGSRGFRVA